MSVTCPHCHNPIEAADGGAGEVPCPCCGSSVHVEPAATTDWHPRDGQRQLGKFELIDLAGVGDFGFVFMARDPELERVVAIKVPRSASLSSREELDRFVDRHGRPVQGLRVSLTPEG